MPGITLTSESPRLLKQQLDETVHFDWYETNLLYNDDRIQIGWSGYQSYPIQFYETEDHAIVLEGHLYDEPNVKSRICDLTEKIFEGDIESIEKYISRRDAEFVLASVEKSSGKVAVLNDALGRLPLYYTDSDSEPIVSRELGMILDSRNVLLDSLGAAQYLLFGYPLGDQTLYSGIKQLSGGSLITISGRELSVDNVHNFRIDKKPNTQRSIDENAKELANLLSDACRRRSNFGPNVVALSGGLDSRAVAAALDDIGAAFTGSHTITPALQI
jgi:asparagine synthase (glutamine-hydrolysing)